MRDFKHAARSLARAPMFAAVTVGTLALAIGANSAIFSVVEAVLLDPLPFPEAERLVSIGGTAPGTNMPDDLGVPDELYLEYASAVPALEDLGLYGTGSSTTRVDGRIEQLFLTQATPSFFTTLGAQPLQGRLPTADDDANVVVLSHWLWQEWFGSDPEVIGRSYEFAQQTRTVIGVLPPDFRFPDERTAFWVPLVIRAAEVSPRLRTRPGGAVGPGVEQEALLAQLAPLPQRVQEDWAVPDMSGRGAVPGGRDAARAITWSTRVDAPVDPAGDGRTGLPDRLHQHGRPVRNARRAGGEDFAVRHALGARRAGHVPDRMAEAVLLATAGGIGGALLAWAAVPSVVRAAPDGRRWIPGAPIPGLAEAGVDLATLAFTAAISVLAAVAFDAPLRALLGRRLAGRPATGGTGWGGLRSGSPERARGAADRVRTLVLLCRLGIARAQLPATEQRGRGLRYGGHLHVPGGGDA
ncbi:MAG: ABC transporter permease [Gemmatimonadota bacterium]